MKRASSISGLNNFPSGDLSLDALSAQEVEDLEREGLLPSSPLPPSPHKRITAAAASPPGWPRQYYYFGLLALLLCSAGILTLRSFQRQGGPRVHGADTGALTLADLVVVLTTDKEHIVLAEATRPARQGIRTYIVTDAEPKTTHLTGPGFDETIVAYPDDDAEGHSSMREALAPFLAAQHFGDSFKWMLYGHDDTFWFPTVLDFLSGFNPNQPFAIAETVVLDDVPAQSPLTPGALPSYAMRSGSGMLISVGLLHNLTLKQCKAYMTQMPEHNHTISDMMLTYCVFRRGFAITDPGYSSTNPGMRLFDGGELAPDGSQDTVARLIRNLNNGCKDYQSCQMDQLVTAHIDSSKFPTVEEAHTFIQMLTTLYTDYLNSHRPVIPMAEEGMDSGAKPAADQADDTAEAQAQRKAP